jgi:hypothetical protein
MRAPQLISRKRAFECENAIEKRCRCRCGGKLHGAKRTGLFDRLSPSDPHYVPKPLDTGLRTIVKLDQVKARQKKHKRYIAHLECGHTITIPGSKLGPNRSRTHCESCAPTAVLVARQRRAEGMDKSLMEFFDKQDKRDRRRRFKASKFATGMFHVVDVNEPDYAIGPGSPKEQPIKELAAMMNLLP